MNALRYIFILGCVGGVVWNRIQAQPVSFSGQVSSWNQMQTRNDERVYEIGMRYLPEYSRTVYQKSQYLIDAQFSANAFGVRSQDDSKFDMDLYRAWIRFATPRFESRLGLQKITFGPAKLLRSLMWFDRLDPRDPLQLTDGVYGLRLRYDFENLSSIWLWGLWGLGQQRGLDIIPNRKQSPEYGGRVQVPAGPGEIALTAHHRMTNASQWSGAVSMNSPVAENRLALDGVWDIGVGIWFESACVHADYHLKTLNWQTFTTVGMDYTLPLANGIYLLGEHMMITMGETLFDPSEQWGSSGMMLSYPLSWLDAVSLYSVYNWDTDMAYQYFSWQRTLNRWVVHVGCFKRSGGVPVFLSQTGVPLGKKGVRLMLVFSY